jgi:hypothetical protein
MKITNWITGETIYECSQCGTLKELVEKAVREGVSLRYANLEDANLEGSDLTNASLTNTSLTNTSLINASLTNASLMNANLENAKLENAKLENVDLRNANLEDANLENVKNFHGDHHPNNYKYHSVWHYSNDQYYIHMGCHRRSITEWYRDFWNNDREFPNDGNEESLKRVEAFNIIRQEIKEDAIQKNLMTDELQEFLNWEIEVK